MVSQRRIWLWWLLGASLLACSSGSGTLDAGTGTDGRAAGDANEMDAGTEDGGDPCIPACRERECGDDGCGGQCGSCASFEHCTDEGRCEPDEFAGPLPVVIFFFDQEHNQIIRLADLNDDGDMLDEGEATVFFDDSDPVTGVSNAQGLWALSPWELLATDNFEPANIIRLSDENRDGDALDDGESTVWFDGALPGGLQLNFPTSLASGPEEGVYLVEGDARADPEERENPSAIYRLFDANGDGDANDPDEVALHAVFRPAGSLITIFDIAFGGKKYSYTIDIDAPSGDPLNYSLDRISPDGARVEELMTSGEVVRQTRDDILLRLSSAASELTYDFRAQELLMPAISQSGLSAIIAVKDLAVAELIGDEPVTVRILWDEESAEVPGAGSASDLFYVVDGTVIWLDSVLDRVVRLIDEDGDGTFRQPTDYHVLYSAEDAPEGAPVPDKLLSLAVARAAESM